jgi:hypothetical protein
MRLPGAIRGERPYPSLTRTACCTWTSSPRTS